MKWLGIAYLTYLGIKALIDRQPIARAWVTAPARRPFRTGLATQLANPKVMLFFGALLPQFVQAQAPPGPQFAILGATFIASDALVFALYGALAHRAGTVLLSRRAGRVLSRITGVAMLGAAARLAAER